MSDAPVDTAPAVAETTTTEVATNVADAPKSPALSIREAFKQYQASKRGGKADVDTTEDPGEGAEGAPAEQAAKEAPAAKPKADPREELKARIREGRKLAAEKLALQREKAEIEAAKADVQLAREIKAAKDAKDWVKVSQLTGIEFNELITQYAQHGRELTAEERLEKLEAERKADAERRAKDSEERAEQERHGKLQTAINNVRELAAKNPQEFRFIKAKGLEAEVVKYALESYRDGRPLTVEQAARAYEADARELSRRRLAEDSELLSDSPGTAPAARNERPAVPTISNRAAAGAPATRASDERARGIAMLKDIDFGF